MDLEGILSNQDSLSVGNPLGTTSRSKTREANTGKEQTQTIPPLEVDELYAYIQKTNKIRGTGVDRSRMRISGNADTGTFR